MHRRTFVKSALAALALGLGATTAAVRAAVVDIYGKLKPGPHPGPIRLPPLPRWNPATDDIDSGDFLCRVHDYERSLLGAAVDFPKVGQIWEACRDCEVTFQAWCTVGGWEAPFCPTTSPVTQRILFPFRAGRIRLEQDERIRIRELDDPNRPLQVSFVPLRYDAFHQQIVPEAESRSASHYVLTLRIAYTMCCPREERCFFRELFRPVENTGLGMT